jgi:hypothetical protein
MLNRNTGIQTFFMALIIIAFLSCSTSGTDPVRVIAELNTGESQDIRLTNGEMVSLSLTGISEIRDSIRNAIRSAKVQVTVDGKKLTLNVGNYNLPIETGKVRIDCPVNRKYLENCDDDAWKLMKDARFRLWPKDSPVFRKGTFTYPIKQDWLASMSQTAVERMNENGFNAVTHLHVVVKK